MTSLLWRESRGCHALDPKGRVDASKTEWIHLAQAIENNKRSTLFSFTPVRTNAARANLIPPSCGMKVRGDLGLFMGNSQRSQLDANAGGRRWELKPGTAKELKVFLQTMLSPLSPKGVLQHRITSKRAMLTCSIQG